MVKDQFCTLLTYINHQPVKSACFNPSSNKLNEKYLAHLIFAGGKFYFLIFGKKQTKQQTIV